MKSKKENIDSILAEASAMLHEEETSFLIATVDSKEGNVRILGNINGGGICTILAAILPTKEDAVGLGIFAGNLIAERRAQEEGNETKTF